MNAYGTDSREQHNRLVGELQKSRFIAAVDASNGSAQFVRPHETYQATEAFKKLFKGVQGVFLVDDSRDELRGGQISEVIQAVGVSNVLDRRPIVSQLIGMDKLGLRRQSGDISMTSEISTEDYTLMGLDNFLSFLSKLPFNEASQRAKLLWDALQALERSRSISYFKGNYRWFYYHRREASFQSQFVHMLNERVWVPDKNGALQPPSTVIFSDTGWAENPNLRSEIRFMPDVVTELAEAMGIEPEAVNFLKQNGITLEQLKERFAERTDEAGDHSDESDSAVADESDGAAPDDQVGKNEADSQEKQEIAPQSGQAETENAVTATTTDQGTTAQAKREFISYVAVDHDENYEESDGLTHQERMSLESQAIDFILSQEPTLQKTPTNNPGFDLFGCDSQGDPVKWIELKSMKGTLNDRPATLTRTQFKFAQEKQDAFWLYVVENAGGPDANIIRIQNPAGNARTFTFDHGWRNAAEALGSQI